MAKILVIDDERSIRSVMKEALELEEHKVTCAEDGMKGLDCLKSEKFDLVFSDIKMEGMDGIEVLENIKENYPDVSVVMISGHGNIETAVECLKKGAFDYLEKPFDLNRLVVCARNALSHTSLVTETKVLKKQVAKTNKMIGESEPIQHLREIIARVAPTDARVLITGENGTGKEVVARQIFELSNRSKGPFVEVNCAAIPPELIESELFGHEKGSFTSAMKQHIGKFEQADGGTLFLDEIGDMSLSAQTKVLRALQENEISRVGGDKAIKVNVRVLAATNKDLKKEIENGNFREDLYHRLSVIPVHVPPLRERREDIPLLVSYFTEIICREQGIAARTFKDEAIEELKKLNWSGNIRELRNVVERLIILCSDAITADDVKMYASPIFL
ncbi:MAG: sigma-54 dependent transcriptional regulator [Paludibacteraceae bacterium]|nr:sigma-54-dependent Fis family transcriptional regulator [Candidatus Physcocola equi]MCQ2234457.1 sigma-54 dependent transcriptional regulator [Paludibacteraceae bacterium]